MNSSKMQTLKSDKYSGKTLQIFCFFQWAEPKSQIGGARKCGKWKSDKYSWKIREIHFKSNLNGIHKIGGAHRMAVTLHSVIQPECTQRIISSSDTYLSNYYPFSTVRDQMKALEGSKEKFDCFKGIVDPTDLQVSWGTWLDTASPPLPSNTSAGVLLSIISL